MTKKGIIFRFICIFLFQSLSAKFWTLRERLKEQFKNLSKEDRDYIEAFGEVSISSKNLDQQEKERFVDLMEQFSVVKVKWGLIK